MVSFKDRLRRAAKKVIDKAIEVLESDDEGPSNRDRGPQLRRACSESDANRLRQADLAPRGRSREARDQNAPKEPCKPVLANTENGKKKAEINGRASPPPYVNPFIRSEDMVLRQPVNNVGSPWNTEGNLNKDDSRRRLQKLRSPAGPVPPVPPLPAQWANLKRNNVLSPEPPKPINKQAAAKVEDVQPPKVEAGPAPRRANSDAAEQARPKKDSWAKQQDEIKRKEQERKKEVKERVEKQRQQILAAAEPNERQREEKLLQRNETEKAGNEHREKEVREVADKSANKKIERPAAEKRKAPKKVVSPLNEQNLKAQQGDFIDGSGDATELDRQLGDMTRTVVEGFITEEEWNVSENARKEREAREEREVAAEAKKAKKFQEAQKQRDEKEALALQKKKDAKNVKDSLAERAVKEALERQKVAEAAQKAKADKARLAGLEKDKKVLEHQKPKDKQEQNRKKAGERQTVKDEQAKVAKTEKDKKSVERQKIKDQQEQDGKDAIERQKLRDGQAKLEKDRKAAERQKIKDQQKQDRKETLERQKVKEEQAKVAKAEKDKKALKSQEIKNQQEQEKMEALELQREKGEKAKLERDRKAAERQRIKDEKEDAAKRKAEERAVADAVRAEREREEARERARLELEAKRAAADAKFTEAAFAQQTVLHRGIGNMDRTIVEGFIEMTPEEIAAEAEVLKRQTRELEERAEAKRLQELAEINQTVLHRGIGNMDRTIVEGFIEIDKKEHRRRAETEKEEET